MPENDPTKTSKKKFALFSTTKTRLENEIEEKKKTEEKLKHRISLEQMVARIASLAIEVREADDFLNTCLRLMGSTLDISRIYFFQRNPDEKTMTNTHEWVADGIFPEKENLQNIPESTLPWWTEQMNQGHIINYKEIEEIPGSNEKKLLMTQGIKSILVVPIMVTNRYHGFIGFDECRYHRNWAPEDVDILKTVGTLLEKYIESKNIEQSLKYSEEKYRRVVEKLHEGILIFRGRDILYANPQMAKMFGVSRKEFLSLDVFAGVHPDNKPQVMELFNIISSGKPLPQNILTVRFLKMDGTKEVLDLELKGEPLLYEGQQAVLVLARDVTEEKKTLNLLKESEARYRLFTENLVDGIFVAKTSPYKYIYGNRAMYTITGYTTEELQSGEERHLKNALPENDYKTLVNYYSNVIPNAKDIIQYEHRMRKKSGEWVWISVSAAPLIYEGEKAFLCSVSDITHRKNLESQLQHSQKMEAVGTLAGGIAHDFNNILNGVLGYAEIGKMEIPEGTPGKDNLDMVIKSGMKARDLIKQILSFSRRHEPELKPLKIAKAVKESLQLLRSTLPSSIYIDVDIQVNNAIIEGDSIQIHQLMLNLCTNSAHAFEGAAGKLGISLHSTVIGSDTPQIHPELSYGDYVHLKVSDNGKGIEPEILEHIFEPYFTTKESGKGTGLGLAAVHGIVKSHKGAILVNSQPGKGTEFNIFFPEIAHDAKEELQETKSGPEKGTGHILVVDDEEDLVMIAKTILTHYGYKVTTFTNPLEALNVFKKNAKIFDLVISDMTMPQLTGEKLSQNIVDVRPDIPIILCSGYSETLSKKESKLSGNQVFLQKPLVADDLLHTVKTLLKN